MKELSIFFDNDHECPDDQLEPYLYDIKSSVKGIFYEMGGYPGLEADLKKLTPCSDFYSCLINNYPGDDRPLFFSPCINLVFNFVLENSLGFWVLGVYEEDIKNNLFKITAENDFNGLYSFIIGSAFQGFVKKQLEPVLAESFDKVTYYLDF